MTRWIVAASLAAGGVLAYAPAARACQPEYCPSPPLSCSFPELQQYCYQPY
jgi:hypothetical protein